MTTLASPATGRWWTRIQRAETLAPLRPDAEEQLRFFAALAGWQQRTAEALEAALPPPAGVPRAPLPREEYPLLRGDVDPGVLGRCLGGFGAVLTEGPRPLAGLGEVLREEPARLERLARAYGLGEIGSFAEETGIPPALAEFAGQAVWQPLLELLGTRAAPLIDLANWYEPACPVCGGPPLCSSLRGLGEARGQRLLVCARCLFEWPFRRLRCPDCGAEQDGAFSPVVAEQYPAIRLDTCSECRCYVKTADARADGRVVAVVDDIATPALDLWANAQGLHRLAPPLVH